MNAIFLKKIVEIKLDKYKKEKTGVILVLDRLEALWQSGKRKVLLLLQSYKILIKF
jgi:hypothetical protein